MKVLFIGGTGIISSACSRLAIERGIDLYHLNRGISQSIREVKGVKNIIADIRDINQTKKALQGHTFDAVVDWIAFETEHIQADIEIFTGITKQFVFISSASAYQTPPEVLPVTEKTPLENPVWLYSRNKIACEQLLQKAWKESGFPYTIVRPSHTYDKTLLPMEGGYTVVDRMLKGKKVIVHGDGSSLWTLTHHKDFAVGLIGLLGNKKAIADDFHITSSELLSWDAIFNLVAKAFNTTASIVHVPSEVIARYDKKIGDSLLGDKTHSMIFDNSKLKSIVHDFNPKINFAEGVEEIAEWYKSNPDKCIVDESTNSLIDTILNDYSKFI